jgi:hypothetical protein
VPCALRLDPALLLALRPARLDFRATFKKAWEVNPRFEVYLPFICCQTFLS